MKANSEVILSDDEANRVKDIVCGSIKAVVKEITEKENMHQGILITCSILYLAETLQRIASIDPLNKGAYIRCAQSAMYNLHGIARGETGANMAAKIRDNATFRPAEIRSA